MKIQHLNFKIKPFPPFDPGAFDELTSMDYNIGPENVDNPGDFSNLVGFDLYLNPWWALRKTISQPAVAFAICMSETFGQPDLWFNGNYHQLLWGNQRAQLAWRPGFFANLSGTNGQLHKSFWLPWRHNPNSIFRTRRIEDTAEEKAKIETEKQAFKPVGCIVPDEKVDRFDVSMLKSYKVILDTLAPTISVA